MDVKKKSTLYEIVVRHHGWSSNDWEPSNRCSLREQFESHGYCTTKERTNGVVRRVRHFKEKDGYTFTSSNGAQKEERNKKETLFHELDIYVEEIDVESKRITSSCGDHYYRGKKIISDEKSYQGDW